MIGHLSGLRRFGPKQPRDSSVVIALLALVGYAILSESRYWMFFTGMLLAYGLFAASLDVLVGYGALLAFTQSALFGIGGYVLVYSVLNLHVSILVAAAFVVVGALALSVVIGFAASRLRGIQLAIVTLCIGQLLWNLAIQQAGLTGGDTGRVALRSQLLPAWAASPRAFLALATAVVVVCVYSLRRAMGSSFGRAFSASRDQEGRLQYLGFSIVAIRVIAFGISGIVAAIAGCIFTLQSQFIDPTSMYWTTTGIALIGLLVGGQATIFGGLLGGALYVGLEERLSNVTQNWQIALGIVLVLVVIYAPEGLLGLGRVARKARRRFADA